MELNFIITLIVFMIFAFICMWRLADMFMMMTKVITGVLRMKSQYMT